ncbi:MAG: hypothetical protein HOL04_00565 [Gammaproteobacteria bacterium]|jgi:hypothetical protein|nr:hypothetical protein [Gammaproteobacteria bacterium]MBT4606174.1 hypothetical protein [Thiotrichales bacterium]MBT3472706.1 hypothetical protein [Gammaproteobacteria bacterium]MBT3968003.1 hypothetical protein [Gammaproteobacteria bacterium]MBT4080997.1 hypothetical protein [Gammaproteobacteria bacterium]
MSTISNDTEFRQALDALSLEQQRTVASRFVQNVLSLSGDSRLQQVIDAVEVGTDLATAFKSAKRVSLEAHARCGSEGDWNEQAGYFVARAAQAAVEPQVRTAGKNPAWKAAMQCRMARTCLASDSDEDTHDLETGAQHQLLTDYLNP